MESIVGPDGQPIEIAPSTLLLVDDEENILSALRRVLRRDGYRVLTAGSGEAGLAVLAQEPKVDLIISDQRMPNMIGTVFLRHARDVSPHSVRIILSGYTDLESVTAAINDGAVYKFLTKPWDDDILRLSIREALHYKWVQDENRLLQGMLMEVNEELARANSRLAEQAEFAQTALESFQQIVHDLPVALLGIDERGRLAFANRAALELLPGKLRPGEPVLASLPPVLAQRIEAGDADDACVDTLTLNGQDYCAQLRPHAQQGRGWLLALFPGARAC
jgi:response regulator RpfG family c-di-GMP phosphodiesterase